MGGVRREAAVGKTLTIADSGYPGTGLLSPHRRKGGKLPDWKQADNKSHKQVRARVEHVPARMKTWKILRDCRLRGYGVLHAMPGIARLHNLNSPDRRAVGLVTDHVQTTPRSFTGQGSGLPQLSVHPRQVYRGRSGRTDL